MFNPPGGARERLEARQTNTLYLSEKGLSESEEELQRFKLRSSSERINYSIQSLVK